MKRFLAFVSFVSLLLLAGCQEEPYLSVSPGSLSFSQDGGSQTIQVSANYVWTARVSGSGFKISPSSGEGVGTVTVTASAATSADEVTGSVSFESEGLTASVSLKQEAKNVIQVGGVARIPAEGGTITVDIQYNTDFTVEVGKDAQAWITFAGTKSLSSGKLTFEVKANDATDPRTGTVTVKDKSGKAQPQTLTFEQEEKKVIQVGETTVIPAEGGSYEVDVQYNTDFTVEVEKDAQSWITFVKTKALKSGKLEFKFAANETYEERTGKATVKDKKETLEPLTLVFTQAARKWVEVTGIRIESESTEVEAGETLALIAVVEPEDASDKTVTWSSGKPEIATVDENGVVTGVKEGSATITAKAGEKSATVKITVIPSVYATERAALEAFYKANDGDHWICHDGWCVDDNLANWYGVQMTSDRKHVRVINMYYNEVDGFIPEQIGDLSELEELSIYNYLNLAKKSGPLPKSIGRLTKLKKLDLQCYSLKGTIPSSLFNLKKLEKLRICHAEDMTPMPIPKEVGQLSELEELDLSEINLTGNLIPEIGRLSKLQKLAMYSNDLTGGVPETFGNLINLETLDLSANHLSGEIPSTFYLLDNFWKLWPNLVWGNEFTQEQLRNAMAPAPKSPPIPMLSGKTLNLAEEIAGNQLTILFSTGPASEGWDIIPALVELYNAHKDEGLGIITYFDNNMPQAADIEKRDNDFREMLSDYNVPWDSFIRHMYEQNPAAPFYAEFGRGLYPFGSIDEIVVIGPEGTVQYSTLLDDQCKARERLEHFMDYLRDLLGTPVVHYESTDYSQDGTVKVLQKASVGNGIDLVITGDAFSDRLIANGTMERVARQAADDFFSQEPFTSLRNRFNVYLVNAVSKYEEYFHGGSTVYSGAFWGPTYVGGDDETVLHYAAKALDDARMEDVVVLVLMNSGLGGGTAYLYDTETDHYAGGPSVTYVPYRDPKVIGGISRKAEVLIHEAGGHGFGRLADEYEVRAYGNISDAKIAYLKECQKKHWFVNVDATPDPDKVLWSRFIGDSRFADENIGVYQGGFTYYSGIWRPTDKSVMNSNYGNQNNFFNAPSRAQIYTRIMKRSEGESWQFDYEDFVAWDIAHRNSVKSAPTARQHTDSAGEELPAAPVVTGKTWRQIK